VVGLAQDTGQRGLAHLDGLPAQVRAIQRQQVEGVEEGPGLVPPAAEQPEGGQPPLVAAHRHRPHAVQDVALAEASSGRTAWGRWLRQLRIAVALNMVRRIGDDYRHGDTWRQVAIT
jgi:hypothetical protein